MPRRYHVQKLCMQCGLNSVADGRTKYCGPECAWEVQLERQRNNDLDGLCKVCELPHNKARVAQFCADCLTERILVRRRKKYAQERKICECCKEKPKEFNNTRYCVECSEFMHGPGRVRRPFTTEQLMEKRLTCQIRRILRVYVKEERVSMSEYFDHLGYTPVEFLNHLARDWPDGFPEDIENYHIDHIIPKNHYKEQGMLESMEDIVKCFALENLRLIPAFDNLSKGKKVIECGV